MDTFFDNDPWTSVSSERSKEKNSPKNPSPGTSKDTKKSKKTVPPKRRSTDLHSVSSAISQAVEKKKSKTVGPPKVQSSLKDHFNTAQVMTKAIPGTAVVSKVTPPMSLKPKPTSPTLPTTNQKPASPTIPNYDDNITKHLNKINKKTNRSASTSPINAPTKSKATMMPSATVTKDISDAMKGASVTMKPLATATKDILAATREKKITAASNPNAPMKPTATVTKDIGAATQKTVVTEQAPLPTGVAIKSKNKSPPVQPAKAKVVDTVEPAMDPTKDANLVASAKKADAIRAALRAETIVSLKGPKPSARPSRFPEHDFLFTEAAKMVAVAGTNLCGEALRQFIWDAINFKLSGNDLKNFIEKAARILPTTTADGEPYSEMDKINKESIEFALGWANPPTGPQTALKPPPAGSVKQPQVYPHSRGPSTQRGGGSRTLAQAMRGGVGRGSGREAYRGRSLFQGRAILPTTRFAMQHTAPGTEPADTFQGPRKYASVFSAMEESNTKHADQSPYAYFTPIETTGTDSYATYVPRTNKYSPYSGDTSFREKLFRPPYGQPTSPIPYFIPPPIDQIPHPPSPPRKPKVAKTQRKVSSFAALQQSLDDEESEAVESNKGKQHPKFKTPETTNDAGDGKGSSGSASSKKGSSGSDSSEMDQHNFTEVSHYSTPADTLSLGIDQSMETNDALDEDDDISHGPILADDFQGSRDFHPKTDEASDATEHKSNFVHAPETKHESEYESEENSSDASSESDDSEAMADLETRCPQPLRPFFHRYDVVVNIPKNNNPTTTVATLIADLMLVLVGVDIEIILYPYRASYEPAAIVTASVLLGFGNETHKYVDKGKFDRFSSRPAPNCRLSIALGSSLRPAALCEDARDGLTQFNMQMYPKLLNFPNVVRAGFLLYSHKHHHSEAFQRDLSKYVSRPVASKWRRAAATTDLHSADYTSVAGKPAFIPSAICIECQEQDLALVRSELQNLYPLSSKSNRFTYPRQVKASFCNTFNRYELEQVDEMSKEFARSLWHIQLLTNLRERYASYTHILRKPRNYEHLVEVDAITTYPSLRRLLLEMLVPYKDSRGEHPALFTSCDHGVQLESTAWDVGVTFRPQHARYAQNVMENLAMHIYHRSGCTKEYVEKVFKRSHILSLRGKRWHEEHEKVYDPKHMQEGLSASELSHAMEEFNLDITVVLQDAAMAVSRSAAALDDGVSAPRAASNASQQLSLLNSITTFPAPDEEMEATARVDLITQPPMTTTMNSQAWASRPSPAATRISLASPSTAATTATMASTESTTIQTSLVQEDSSLTTATEHIGMSEAQIQQLLEAHERKWQAKLASEVALKLAEQRENDRKAQQQARKSRRNKPRDQTAHSHGGGLSP
jgi:hypothetical protein